ncbi:PAS domain S-box protein [Litorimonas sp. RW-G-Af-16]|uniref:PAS domain S-box protein n=1 Tax=Litorimonas sp. RW-G-Af-16 TaxID=3241168 RepID=UPI003AAB93B7
MDNDSSHFELDAVLHTLVDGVIMINGKGEIARYNPACEKIFGYKFSEVEGRNIRCLMPEPYRENHDDYIANYQSSGTAKIIGIGREVSGKRKDGNIFPMYLSVGEIPNVKGRAYVGIIRDLTLERQRQEEFEHLQNAHFHLSRVSAMDQMGAAIAHELNQPLTAIMNYLDAGVTILARPKPPIKRYYLP